VDEAVRQINLLRPELLFLDIHIKGGTGFDVLSKVIEKTFEVIFITAHSNYTLQALRSQALDYILKPINKNEFIDAVERVSKLQSNSKKEIPSSTFLSIYTSAGLEFIKFDSIVFLEADGAYTTIHTQDNHIVSTKNIGEYEAILPAIFYRCHHSFIINLNQIKKFTKGRSGVLIMNNDHRVAVSQRKMKEFSSRISI
jgi:two-component system LytT family response regulator